MNYYRYIRPIVTTLLLLALVGGAGVAGVSYCTKRIGVVANEALPALSHLALANQYRGQGFMHLVRSVSSKDKGELRLHQEEIRKISAFSGEHLAEYRKTILTEENRRLYDEMMADREAYVSLREKVMASMEVGDQAAAMAQLDQSVMPLYLRYLENGQKLVHYAANTGEKNLREIQRFIVGTIGVALVTSMLIFVAGFFIGYTR